MRRSGDRASGYSLVELAMALAIALLLAAAATSGFRALLDRFRVSVACADFRAALSIARAEAMRRMQRVDLLPTQPGNWAAGWRVVIDADNNQRVDPGEAVLHASPAVATVRITATLTDRKDYIAFGPGGRPRTAASADTPQFGSVVFRCGQQRRKLVIGVLGRVRVCDPDRDGAAC